MKRQLTYLRLLASANTGGHTVAPLMLDTVAHWTGSARISLRWPDGTGLRLARGESLPEPLAANAGPGVVVGPRALTFELDHGLGLQLERDPGQAVFRRAERELIEQSLGYFSRAFGDERPTRGPYVGTGERAWLLFGRSGELLYASPRGNRLCALFGFAHERGEAEGAYLPELLARHAGAEANTCVNRWGCFRVQSECLNGRQGPALGLAIEWCEPRPVRLLRHLRDTPLSGKQQEICLLLSYGMSKAAVAERIGISPYTVAEHVREIFVRLGVNSVAAMLELLYADPESTPDSSAAQSLEASIRHADPFVRGQVRAD